MNKVIDKGFRSCHFVSTIVKHPVYQQYFPIEALCCCSVQCVRNPKLLLCLWPWL